MKVLLDTCAFLWLIRDAPELSDAARALFQDPANEVFLSAASAWEMSIKHGLGRLPLPEDPARLVPRQRARHGILSLPIDEEATLTAHRLPSHHRDPFDRLLVSQALAGGMVILTPDRDIAAYPVRTAW
jgi:PIN domain nuclease of toxin-antitoxin system